MIWFVVIISFIFIGLYITEGLDWFLNRHKRKMDKGSDILLEQKMFEKSMANMCIDLELIRGIFIEGVYYDKNEIWNNDTQKYIAAASLKQMINRNIDVAYLMRKTDLVYKVYGRD